jgi:hypothetical protein
LRAGGASLDALAEKFGVERDAVRRHWLNHVTPDMKAKYLCGPAELANLAEKAAEEGDSVLDYLRAIRTMLMGQLAAVTEAGDARSAAYVGARLTHVLEVIAKVTGEIGQLAQSISITNNVAVLAEHPHFLKVQASLLRALAPFPDARAAVVVALQALDEENAPAATAGPPRVIEHHAAA